jgi:hypothetical protein
MICILGPVVKYVYWGVEETNYLNFGGGGGMRRITTSVGGYETKNEWNLCLRLIKLQTFIIQYTFKKIECMFLNVPNRKLQCIAK